MTRKGNVTKVEQFRSSGGTSMFSACSVKWGCDRSRDVAMATDFFVTVTNVQ